MSKSSQSKETLTRKRKKVKKTTELDEGKFVSKDFDRLFKGIKKPALTVFSGDKDLYHDWKAQFEIFLDRMKVPAKSKMMMLKNSLSGKPLRVFAVSGWAAELDNINLPWKNLITSTGVKSGSKHGSQCLPRRRVRFN